jgi:hypothetical protein
VAWNLTGNIRGPAGAAPVLALGSKVQAALANNATATVILPLSRTMPTNTYEIQYAHSGGTTAANMAVTTVTKTTTQVTLAIRAAGALAAGTISVIAY